MDDPRDAARDDPGAGAPSRLDSIMGIVGDMDPMHHPAFIPSLRKYWSNRSNPTAR